MKHIFLIALLLICYGLSAGTWQTYTNSDHVYDLLINNNNLYLGTWGGIIKLPTSWDSSQQTLINTGNGLISNDIRSLAYIGFSNSLWMGSSDKGISISSPQGYQELNTTLGLPSSKVNKIIENESTILVATSAGLAVFYYLPGVSFPLMLHQYTYENTSGGLPGNNIHDMVLADNGNLFVATSSGISYTHLDSLDVDSAWKSIHSAGSPVPIGGLPKLSVNATKIAIAVDNRVFVHSLDLASGSWQIYNSINALSGTTVSSVMIDADNQLWVSYGIWNETLLTLTNPDAILLTSIDVNGISTQWPTYAMGLGYSPISRIVHSEDGIYLCSWGQGIYRKTDSEWQNWTPSNIGFPKISQIVTDKNYDIWFASGYIDNNPVRKGTMGVSKLSGSNWSTYNIANSPIHSDNILGVAVDNQNRKWFATWDNTDSPSGWGRGISILDESGESNLWKHITTDGIRTYNNETNSWGDWSGSTTLSTSTIGGIYPAQDDLMLVLCYDGAIDVLNPALQKVSTFTLPNSVEQQMLYAFYNGEKYFFGTNNDRGLTIWNDNSIPISGGSHWEIPPPPELSNCIVYGVVTVETPYEGKQHWIAASTGLFMWNETSWYRYDTMIKRFRFNTSTYQWVNDTLYYEDEERLFGSVRTTPTSILLDPFNRIWIGSMENGMTMYNPSTERFTNYYQPNSPLLSNYITTLGYDPVQGNLLIGTPDGFNTLKIGRIVKPYTPLLEVKAYPNPFKPAIHQNVQIVNLPEDSLPTGESECRIFDSSGALIVNLKENAFSRFEWNGKSSSGKECKSGIYFFVVADQKGNVKRGKLAVIN